MSSVAQSAIQKKLLEGFTEARLRNPQVSMRAYAKRVALSPAALSEILRGKRSLSMKRAKVLLEKMNMDPVESHRIISLFQTRSPEASAHAFNRESAQAANDQFSAVSSWYHFAILSLAQTDAFQSNTDWIADRLGIKRREAKDAVERLLRLHLLQELEDGRLVASGLQFSTPDEVHQLALRRVQGENLELARKALEEDEGQTREFSSMTLAMSPDKLPIAKKLVRQFLQDLTSVLESSPRRDVFKVNVQLFQLTKDVSIVQAQPLQQEPIERHLELTL